MNLSLARLCALALTLGSSLALAGAKEDPAVPELCRLVMSREAYDSMMEEMFTQMTASFPPGVLPADALPKLKQLTRDLVSYDEMQTWMVEIYGPRFSADEVRQLVAFYKTPLGKKLAKLTPELQSEIGKRMGPVVMQRLPVAMQKAGLMPTAPPPAP